MAQAASLWVKLGLSDKDFADGLKRAENQLNRFGSRLSSIGSRLTVGLSLPLAAISGAAVKLGMDAVESENLFTVSMGRMADSARAWSQDLRKQLGLNEYELRKNVGVFNVMLNSMGVGEKAAYDMATGLTKLAYDMASFYNLNPEEAFQKLQSGISGEVEPLKRLGIIVNETTTKTWALNNGLIKQGQEMSEAQKVMARYGAIMEQTTKAQGDLARTLDSPANRLRILQEQLKMTATDLGVALLPAVTGFLQAVTPFVQLLGELSQWFGQLPEPIRNTTAGILALAIGTGPLVLVMGKVIQGWSALIGLMRLLPGLNVVRFFTEYSTAIAASAAGSQAAGSAIAFMNAQMLQAAATTSAYLGVLWSLKTAFDSFKDLQLHTMKTGDISKITDLGKAMDIQSGLKKELSRLENAKSKVQKWDTEGIKLYKQEIDDLTKKLNAVQDVIKKLTTPNVQGNNYKLPNANSFNIPSGDSGSNTVSKALTDYVKNLNQINTMADLNIKGYDAQQEKVNELTKAIEEAISAQDSQSESSKAIISGMVDALKTLEDETGKAKGFSDSGIKESGGAVKDFTFDLQQASNALGEFQGPLADFGGKAKSLIDAFSNLQAKMKDFEAAKDSGNSANTMSAGMGAFGAVMAFAGLLTELYKEFSGFNSRTKEAAEKQLKAAEAWQKFINDASVGDLLREKAELERQLAHQYPNAAANNSQQRLDQINNELLVQSLRINIPDLRALVQDAFSSVDLTEFRTKFESNFKETLRNALINAFLEASILQPLQDAIKTAFQSAYMVNGVNMYLSPEEMKSIQDLQDQLYGKSSSFYQLLEQLGFGMEDLSEATNQATASMRNVPAGFKVDLNRFTLAEGIPSFEDGGRVAPVPGGRLVRVGEGGEWENIIPDSQMGGGGITINFNAPVYGTEDFKRQVKQAAAEYFSGINTMRYGVSGAR